MRHFAVVRPSCSTPRGLCALGVVAAALLGLALSSAACSREGKPLAASRETAPAVPEVATVTLQATRVALTIELPGRTSAYSMAEIRPQVGGIIQKRLFEEGSEIRAGQVLYQIDPAPLQAAYDNAAANLAAARKAADRARAAPGRRAVPASCGSRPSSRTPARTASASRTSSRRAPCPPASATRP